MSTERDLHGDINRVVRSWLREDRHEDADRVLGAVLDELDTTPQRPSSWLARRTPVMNSFLKFGLAAAAVVAAVVIGLQFIGTRNVVAPPGATPTPSTPAPSAAATIQPFPSVRGSNLTAGTYFLEEFPVGLTFTVPDRWQACSESPVEQLVCYFPGSGDYAGELGFVIVTNAAADPCAPGEVFLDPPIGPSVDDLVTALSNLEGYEVTTPVNTSIDGFGGKLLTVTAPSDGNATSAECGGFAPWTTEDRTTGMVPGETAVLRVIDVEGVRIMITNSAYPGSPYEAEFDDVLDSVQIEP